MTARWMTGPMAVVLAAALSAVGFQSAGAVGLGDCVPSHESARDIRYRKASGSDLSSTSLDIFPTQQACPAPVVVWVHGGGWQIGDKAYGQRDKVRLFNGLGYTYVSVNYRLTDPDAADPVQYPVHEQDVAAAVAWVHEHIERYGGDPDEIALLGHSAGAQIVALLATDEEFLDRHDLGLDAIACVVPLDTEGFDVTAAATAGGRESQIYRAAFGTDATVWEDASALEHVEPGKRIPPMLLVLRGTPRRRCGVESFIGALRDAGVDVTSVDVGGYSHADVNQQIGVRGEQVITPALTSFLEDCFSG